MRNLTPPTAASVITLLDSIERVGPDAPAAIAFRSALARKGREITEAGGADALADILARVRAADPTRAGTREALVTAAWAGLPGLAA